jgi:hypothetical protein
MRKRCLLVFSVVMTAAACPPATTPDDPGTGSSGTGGSSSTGGSGASTGGSPGSTGGAAASGGSSGSGTGGNGTGGSSGNGAGGSSGTGGVPASGGAGGSAGTGGTSAGQDAASDAPATPPGNGGGCAGAKKCFDFEDQMPGKQPTSADFTVEIHGGSITTDATKAYGGKQSVLIKTGTGGNFPGNNLIFNGIEKLLPDNDLHGRVMVWMDQTPGMAHWDSIMGSAAGGANPTYIMGGMYKKFMSVYHPGDCSVDSSTPFPTGVWACLQWEFKGTKEGKHLHKMMLNGEVVNNGIQDAAQGFPSKDWKAPTFSQLKVGFRHFGSPNPVNMWIDDLAFGDQPIPCPKM